MTTSDRLPLYLAERLLSQLAMRGIDSVEVQSATAQINAALASDDVELLIFLNRYCVIRCDILSMIGVAAAVRAARPGEPLKEISLDHILAYYDLRWAVARHGLASSTDDTPTPVEADRQHAEALFVMLGNSLSLVPSVIRAVRRLNTVDPDQIMQSLMPLDPEPSYEFIASP